MNTVISRSILFFTFRFKATNIGLNSFAFNETAVLSLISQNVLKFVFWSIRWSLTTHHYHSFHDDQTSPPCGIQAFLYTNLEIMCKWIANFMSMWGKIVDKFSKRSLFEQLLFVSCVAGDFLQVLLLSRYRRYRLMQLVY